MHELAISEAIVSQVCEHLGTTRVSRVVVEIGQLSAVVPDAVRFCFDLAAKGTTVEGALLEIIEVSPSGRCRQCGSNALVVDLPWVSCDGCGSVEVDFIRGQELRIKSVEVS